jgi:phosphomannomutase
MTMKTISLVAFDLDDTLAPSKSPLPVDVTQALLDLLAVRPVCIISGGQYGQFESQIIANLPDSPLLERLHLMPTNGTRYHSYVDGQWVEQYAHELSPELRDRAMAALEEQAKRLGLWEVDTWGPILEDRGSQVTFSALGQAAPVDAKKAWDPDGSKRADLRAAVAPHLPDLDVHAGGSTSIDITTRGIDKAYGISRLAEILDLSLGDILFVGDRLMPGGNDFPVVALGVQTHAVTGWEDTLDFVRGLLPFLA